MSQQVEQIVKTYKAKYRVFWWKSPESVMAGDANRMAAQGWRVASQSVRRSPLITGRSITVVYQR